MKPAPSIVYGVEALFGILVWWLCTSASGVVEAWDAEFYFSIGYPLFAATVIFAGWISGNGWRHGLMIMGAQALPLLLTAPPELRPVPDGLVVLLLLALPLVALGAIASRLGRRRRTT